MVILTGKNLGDRHKDLNCKVAEFVADKKSFDDLKVEEELTDVDKLYKIDIASRYQDVDYIVEVLKSGDSLYISRALKCDWLYNDSNSHIINVENLHVNIFPFMPLKMKVKMLTTISIHVRNNDRVATFFTYCIQNQMKEIAFKFLNFSSEEFKIYVINNYYTLSFSSYLSKNKNRQNFTGNSFALASALLKKVHDFQHIKVYLAMRYLYTTNNEKYLDCFEDLSTTNNEKYLDVCRSDSTSDFGIRMSKDIMIRHKDRVLKKPFHYIKYIKKSMLVKYSSKSDAEQYLTMIMPDTATRFWGLNFCQQYKYILDLIPISEKFEFIKKLFTTKYPGEDFEMARNFYQLQYYNLMSSDQRELWALRHIDEHKEILGSGKDYLWCKFVNIDKAIKEIRKYIFITPNNSDRSDIVDILVEAAKDQNDLLKVLNYYYARHINEETNFKQKFIDKVLQVHNVFEFNIECWEALNKILCSLKIFIPGKYCSNPVFFAVSVACHILHNQDMPQALIEFIDLDINYSYFGILLNKLGKDKSQVVFQYLLKIYVDKLKPYENKPVNRNVNKNLKKYINNIYNLINCFNKTKEDCPEFVKKINDIISPQPKQPKTVTEKDIFTFIKTDVSQAIDILSHFDRNINDWPAISTKNSLLNKTFRKLKVYFQNDVAKEYMKFFDKILHKLTDDHHSHMIMKSVVSAIFQLADENYKVGMMEKYKPLQPKIDYELVDMKLLCIQEAICKFVGYSRPPIPSKNVFEYMKGDYVHYCLPIFNMYSANLPPLMVMKFINDTLNMPLSVQKHGLRLAFKWFTTDDFKTLLLNTWKNSKNISLRKIIYQLVSDKITSEGRYAEGERAQTLFEILKFFTSDLHEDDDQYIFERIGICTKEIPHQFIDSYLSTAWDMAIKLPPKSPNIRRQSCIIDCIIYNIHEVQRDFIYKRIIEEHVHEMLEQRKLKPPELHELNKLHGRKWFLIKKFIMGYSGNEEKEQSMEVMSYIFKLCLGGWHEKYNGCRIFRTFLFTFINDLQSESLQYHTQLCHVTFFEKIIDMLMETLPLKEIYLVFWNLKVTIFYIMSSNETPPCQLHEKYQMISDAFAIHVGNFVKKLLDEQQFYAVFLPEIAQIIAKPCIETDISQTSYLCKSLANLEMKETHLLTLVILNIDWASIQEVLSQILTKIQSYENEEVQTYMIQTELKLTHNIHGSSPHQQ